MRGLVVEDGTLRLARDLAPPRPAPGEVRVRVLCAGVCATDLALARGYMGFRGVPGHEFVGEALEGRLAGQRVVGEINASCGECAACRAGLERHCPARSVLGILGRPGAFAEELTLPEDNLHALHEDLPSERAVFTEPLAAAFELLEQGAQEPGARALVAGDGRLGLLCAQVLDSAGLDVTLAGRHPERAGWLPPSIRHVTGLLEADPEPRRNAPRFDLAVEASGRPELLQRVLETVRPRGTVFLKTTSEVPAAIDLAPVVVDEISLVGSRCGPFGPALRALHEGVVRVDPMLHGRYPLEQAESALERAAQPGVLKILIDVAGP